MTISLSKAFDLCCQTGIGALILSLVSFGWMVALKYFYHTAFVETLLPLLVSTFFLLGLLLFISALTTEMLMRIWDESNSRGI